MYLKSSYSGFANFVLFILSYEPTVSLQVQTYL